MRTLEEVENYFKYHAPDDKARNIHEEINALFISNARLLWEMIPPFNQSSPDKTVMFRSLSDTRMQANMAVACFVPPTTSAPQGETNAS